MGAKTGISWTDHTFNPWWGCVRVSPGCEHCYAETFSKRVGEAVWGVDAERRFFGDKHWNEPKKWNREAEKAGERARVFCASMADVFEDRPDLVAEREKLWTLIHCTPWLDWQLLTKRPENIRRMLPPSWGTGWPNVWLGVTGEDQEWADRRLRELLTIDAVVRFVSYEPALGPVNFTPHLGGLDWIIIGGESGNKARPFNLNWARDVIEQCAHAGVACFMKQFGKEPYEAPAHVTPYTSGPDAILCRLYELDIDKAKGGDPVEWPEGLRVREFPVGHAEL